MSVMVKYPGTLTKRTVITHRYPKVDDITAVPIACNTHKTWYEGQLTRKSRNPCRMASQRDYGKRDLLQRRFSTSPFGTMSPPLSGIHQQLSHTYKNVTKQGEMSAGGGGVMAYPLSIDCLTKYPLMAESRARNRTNACDFSVWQLAALSNPSRSECFHGLDPPLILLSTHMESHSILQRQERLNSCDLIPLNGLGDELTATYDHYTLRLPYVYMS
jgi:hypothetical protein